MSNLTTWPPVGALGVRYTYAEKRDRGLALMEKARALNSSHPGWYWNALVYLHYENRDYQAPFACLAAR